jgi:hypothetical protein
MCRPARVATERHAGDLWKYGGVVAFLANEPGRIGDPDR